MHKQKILAILTAMVTLLSLLGPSFGVSARPLLAATAPAMGTAQSFAVLAGAGITNTGATTITGDVGTSPTPSESGFTSCPGANCVTLTGTNHAGDAVTIEAKTDLAVAYTTLAGETPTIPIVADLGTMGVLTPGIYHSDSSIGLTGTLTLDGVGDPNAIFIFQAGSSLTTATNSKVVLENGAQACNIFWSAYSSATLGTYSNFIGTIITSQEAITDDGYSTINGNLLANIAAVTLNHTTITRPLCSPSTATALSAKTIVAGHSVNDTATLLGGTPNTGGTVTYTAYSDPACILNPQVAGTPVTVTNGVVPNSTSLSFPTTGTFYWQAVYSGDANNVTSKSACTSEPLIVTSAALKTPTLATRLSSTTSAIGGSVNDTATLTGATGTAGGTVVYTYYTDSHCSLNAVAAGTVNVSNGTIPSSTSLPFNAAGTYYWQAVYSGDPANNGATSTCNVAIENLTVNKAIPSLTTALSSNPITVSGTAHDTATLIGATSNAIGTVTYTVYSDSLCTLNAQAAGIETVVNGVIPNSGTITFPTAGTFYWQAVYTGGPNNNGAKSACTSEALLVNSPTKITPTLTTLLSSLIISAGGAVHDSAILIRGIGTPVPSGSVTYTLFTNNTCTLGAQIAGTVTLASNGNIPNSSPITFNTAGTYYWQAIYSGDANYNGATSACTTEALTVNAASGGSSPTSTPTPGKLPGTGFAANRVTILPQQSTSYANLGDLWLEIPSLGVQMPIVGVPQQADGEWDVSWLGNNSGWLNGTAFPTYSGNSVLTGHVTNADGTPGPFAHLNGLWWGDQVIVHAWGAQYIYEVRSVLVVTPEAVSSVITHKDLPWVTLITCRGYDEASNSYNYRVAVGAVLVAVK